ncbi:hypothetical protein HMPREF1127_0477 [Fusobacterium necrophorum subsp. funduliforme Fnf 1007]|uniref:Uncharacterized protein n=1 Tax=Fusobacterium necrophorum subsp. funduliforme Fnf 1007 TaxID=1161424 RepID=A0AAN4AS44_9FUSO|nr:hypothetical protein HMPREF1127_0477 [Fusobacterium necrophorum subsp. funduliforme Fnf 1007]
MEFVNFISRRMKKLYIAGRVHSIKNILPLRQKMNITENNRVG